jgi:hypothetical protein
MTIFKGYLYIIRNEEQEMSWKRLEIRVARVPVVTISLFLGGLILTQHLSFPWTMIDRLRLESTMFIFLQLGFFLALSNHQATSSVE